MAVVIATACVGGQLLAATHEATERHVRCAEHGEITHVGPGADGAVDAPRDAPRDAAWAGAQVEATAAHDHCSFVIAARRPQGQRIVFASAAPAIAPPAPPAPAPILPSQTDRILLSAPKHAPPCA
jgi:hypothetical protein